MIDIHERTKTANSYEFYGPSVWDGCIQYLLSKGLSDTEVVVWLESKHMRWAWDVANPAPSSPTIQMFKDYVEHAYPGQKLRDEVNLLSTELETRSNF